jgi:hypothetical protein
MISRPQNDQMKMREIIRLFFLIVFGFPGFVLTVHSEETAETANTETPAVETDASTAVDESSVSKLRPSKIKSRVGGRLRLEYEYQELGDYEDNDFFGRLNAYGYDLKDGRLDLYTSMRLNQDLDEPASLNLAEDPLADIDNADGVTDDRLLQLYADMHDRDKDYAFRLGRQYVDIADFLQIDGGQMMVNENKKFGGRAYFGQPVSYYTSVSGDYAGGISLVGRPMEGNRSRFTFARYHDDSESDSDRHYFLDIRQQFTDFSRARGQVSVLNEEYRMARLDYFYYSEDGATDLSLGGSYWGSFDAATRAYSPLYRQLGEQDPYTYTYARLTQKIIDDWFLSPGISLRLADQTGENDYNNRDYERYDITFIYDPSRAFSSSLAVEYWSVEEGDSFYGLSGDIRYRHGRVWEISGGASFAEYSYDTFSDLSYTVSGGQTVFTDTGTIIEESPFVYTYFLRGKYRLTRHLTLRAQGDIEDNDEYEDLAYRIRGSVEVKF